MLSCLARLGKDKDSPPRIANDHFFVLYVTMLSDEKFQFVGFIRKSIPLIVMINHYLAFLSLFCASPLLRKIEIL